MGPLRAARVDAERLRQGGSVGADGPPVGRKGDLRPVWGEGVGDAPFVRADEVSPGELGDDGLEEKPIDLGGRQGGLDRAADEAFPVEGRDGGDEVEGVPVWGPEVVRDDGVELPVVLPADQLDEVLVLFELLVGVCLDGIDPCSCWMALC